jgi:F-type H+-transporting ATPase subunit delta
MANTTVARPYAKAAFEYALQHHALAEWSDMLRGAALIVEHEQIQPLLTHPKVSQQQLAAIIVELSATSLSEDSLNFVQLLAAERRLAALPEIVNLYQQYRAAHEQVITAEVSSAFPLDEKVQAQMAASLSERLQRKVKLHCQIDQHLIGGAIVKIGDFVIDGSVSGKLARIASALAM